MLDNAAEFLLRPGKKPGHIFKREQRNIEGIAEAHEARPLDGCVDIENSSEVRRLVTDNAGGAAIKPRKAHDQILGVVLVDLKEIAVVHDGMNRVFDVVRFLRIGGNERIQAFIPARGRIRRSTARRIFEVVRGQKTH